ncbi:MAG: methyltransferase domain-containing protein [Ignavibacteriaceae bacterium]|jgi:cyclopropane fatty-acyl-phospholipid synthase-like methyltransferase|nr:methyltransferase domain-containing protein [Ignavibacteriaceae bacterium]
MSAFTPQDVANYYDQTENHYRRFWKLEKSLSLHYGIWSEGIKNLHEAVLNTNTLLAKLGEIKSTDVVLDAGCGVGGSAIYLAKNIGCKVSGITLSEKQAETATEFAKQHGVSNLASFHAMNYTATSFANNSFDVVWAIESMQTAVNKSDFLKEAKRILKPGGKIVIADCFKSYDYPFEKNKLMNLMFNGWAVSDVLSSEEFINKANQFGFTLEKEQDVTKEVYPSVVRFFFAAFWGMFGTFLYNTFVKKASYFSRVHYKTGIAQFFAYHKKLWTYNLLVLKCEK